VQGGQDIFKLDLRPAAPNSSLPSKTLQSAFAAAELGGNDVAAADAPPAKKPRRAAAQAARGVISSAAAVLRGSADDDGERGERALPSQPVAFGRGGAFAPRPGTWGHAQMLARMNGTTAAYPPTSTDQHVQMLLLQAAQQQAQQYHQQQLARQLEQGDGDHDGLEVKAESDLEAAEALLQQQQQQPQDLLQQQDVDKEGQAAADQEEEQLEQEQQPWQPQQLPWQLQQIPGFQPQPLPEGLQRKPAAVRGRRPSGPRAVVVDASAPAFRGGAAKRVIQPKSCFKGLAWDQRERAWRVRVSYNGKQRHIGR